MARDQHESHENKVASSFITDKTPRSALEASGYDPDLFDVVEKNVNGGFHQRTQWIRDRTEILLLQLDSKEPAAEATVLHDALNDTERLITYRTDTAGFQRACSRSHSAARCPKRHGESVETH